MQQLGLNPNRVLVLGSSGLRCAFHAWSLTYQFLGSEMTALCVYHLLNSPLMIQQGNGILGLNGLLAEMTMAVVFF